MAVKFLVALSCLVAAVDVGNAAISLDTTVSVNQPIASNTVSTQAFSTTSGNHLLLAFVSTDWLSGPNTTVTRITGGGLTWTLVVRANAQKGTSEIWRAFAPLPVNNVSVSATLSQSVVSSMTVISFAGVDPSGTNGSAAVGASAKQSAASGPPSASLVTTRNNSWVLGVGNDFDHAIARVPGPNQVLINQYLAPVGDTYWVQRQNFPTPLSGTAVTLNDTAPTTDSYNVAAVEVLPASVSGATYTLSGSITPAASGSGAGVSLAQNGSVLTVGTADSSGNYSFSGLANGTYTITPAKPGFTFTPASQSVTVSGANLIVPAFAAMQTNWTISGTVSPASSGIGTLLTLSGPVTATATADTAGNYTIGGLPNGNYVVSPSKAGFTFSPANIPVSINGANSTGVNFTATAVATWSISGVVSPASSGAGTLLTLSGSPGGSTTADSLGAYSFNGLPNGAYVITPSKTGYSFVPSSAQVNVNGGNVTGISFSAQATSTTPGNYPDLSDILPSAQMSITGSGSTRMFQYTHDTFNGGSGPLVIQPVYRQASGTYQGIQYVYAFGSGKWTLVKQIPIAGAFVFDAAHGHFHFPFASYGLYAMNTDGSIGAPVSLSTKTGFCIADSFIYDPSLPNAGALGNLGSCTDPTSLRGLDIGAVDEYDQTDEGQSISISGVPDGIYWLRAIVDPNNYLAESNKGNNETDVKLSISGNSVQVLQTVTPSLPPPPVVTLLTPADGSTVAGTVSLTASTTTPTGVQFFLDGVAIGGTVTTTPYTLAWNTSLVPNGTHWLAVQTTDAGGRIGTSAVATVTVSNGSSPDTTPPTVQVTDPASNATVSASVALTATAADDTIVTGLQFYVDGLAVGGPLAAPPYISYWNTLSVPDGQHIITASATDSAGLVGHSSPVTVTVDNSHPPNAIGTDVVISVDGAGTMQTSSFSTSTSGEFLVAFVAYDGPAGVPQTATISGAGLIWTLLKRSNVQGGTAEIWGAKATGPLTNVTVISQASVGSSYHGSLTVVGFNNAAGPGVVGQASSPGGAPDIYLPGVSAGDWVFAVGNDWDNAIARTPVSGQILVHQRIDTQVGDTYWVQSTASPSSAYSVVDIHDTSPTTDQWNYAAVEIVATRK